MSVFQKKKRIFATEICLAPTSPLLTAPTSGSMALPQRERSLRHRLWKVGLLVSMVFPADGLSITNKSRGLFDFFPKDENKKRKTLRLPFFFLMQKLIKKREKGGEKKKISPHTPFIRKKGIGKSR